jgi:4-hydroxybenzoate polyprenyltransferase
MAFERFRSFMDVGRVQGVPVTAAIAILGSLTAGHGPSLPDLFWLFVISVFAHFGGAAMNELWDRNLDGAVKELSRKPLVSGAVTPEQVKGLIACCVPVSLLLALYIFGIPAFIAMLIATLWMHWYCTVGKRTFIVNDFSQCVGFGAYALFGALAVGTPTALTWPLVGVVATLNLFAQWGNNLKDADNDRRFGIPSIAVRTGVSSARGLGARHPYFVYGAAVKAAFMTFCTLPVFLVSVPMAYILVVLSLGWPVQYFTTREFIGRKTRREHVHLLLGDLLASYPAAAAISIIGAGLTGFLMLAVFVFVGYLAGSALQSGAEFKFRVPASGRARRRTESKARPSRISGAPFMITWAPGGKSGFVETRSHLRAIRPPDPAPTRRRDGSRCDGVCIVEPVD